VAQYIAMIVMNLVTPEAAVKQELMFNKPALRPTLLILNNTAYF